MVDAASFAAEASRYGTRLKPGAVTVASLPSTNWSVPRGKGHSDLDCEPQDVEHITASGIAQDEPSCSAGDLGTCGVAVDLRALPHC